MSNDNSFGKVLMVIGGALLTGKIISVLTEDDSASVRKKQNKSLKSNLKENQTDFLVRIDKTISDSSEADSKISQSGERKYPDSYYTLSKSQQYKYRKKMAEDLIKISEER